MHTYFKYEPASFAETFSLHGCLLSVPLSPDEVLEASKRSGNPNPEANEEWINMAANLRDGDEIRLVNCGSGGAYYALIRESRIMFKFYPMILD